MKNSKSPVHMKMKKKHSFFSLLLLLSVSDYMKNILSGDVGFQTEMG